MEGLDPCDVKQEIPSFLLTTVRSNENEVLGDSRRLDDTDYELSTGSLCETAKEGQQLFRLMGAKLLQRNMNTEGPVSQIIGMHVRCSLVQLVDDVGAKAPPSPRQRAESCD